MIPKFGDTIALEILNLEKEKALIKYEKVGQGKRLQKCDDCGDVNSDQFQLCYKHRGIEVYECFNCKYRALKPK